MIKRILTALVAPPYLRKEYDPTTVSNRKRRWWIFNLWLMSLGYTYYMLKDQARTDKEGEFYLFEWFTGRKSIFQKQQEALNTAIEDGFQDLISRIDDDLAITESVFGPDGPTVPD